MKAKTVVFLLSILMLVAASHADNSVASVMGTVKDISANSITVERMGKTPTSVTIWLLPSTKFIKDGVATSIKNLKVGDRVVVSVKPEGNQFTALSIVFGQIFQHMDMHHE